MHIPLIIPVLISGAAPASPPKLGRVAAGIPLEAVEERERGELLALLTAPGRYALQVADDSMCEAGILRGDFVVVQSTQQAANGDIVVALVDGEQLVLSRIRHRPQNRIELLADSRAGENRLLAASRLRIQGKVVGQVRRYR